jgi:hypothetical protein
VFWVISVYFNIRNILPKSGTFLLGHPVYIVKGNKAHELQKKSCALVLYVAVAPNIQSAQKVANFLTNAKKERAVDTVILYLFIFLLVS